MHSMIFGLAIIINLIPQSIETPVLHNGNTGPLDIEGLEYLGSSSSKQLYITTSRKSSFQFALGFGCPIVYGSENNLTLAAIETLDEVQILDKYFAETAQEDLPVELVWTSGVDRLGHIKQWASTGKGIEQYPTRFQGDWNAGQGDSPPVADYNCVALWRYCNKEQGHGPTIPSCFPAPFGTWFTPRPCSEERRYICQRTV